jgi:hypothetical protein
MRRTVSLSLVLFVLTLQNLSAQDFLPQSTVVASDSLTIEETLYPLPTFPDFRPEHRAISDFSDMNSLKPADLSLPPKFTMLELTPAQSRYNHFTNNDFTTPMLVSNGGYMPLVGKGDWQLGLTGSLQNYPSMGFSNSISVGNSWAVSDRVTLYGNVYASDNMHHATRFKDVGVSGRVRIQVAERVFLNGYGNYSIYNNAGGQPLPQLMYPANSFGGTVEVKITDKFGLQAGAERGFNMFTRQWETSYYVLPVFY